MIDETIFELKGCFVIAFGARALPSFNTTACDVTGSVRFVGQLTNNHFFTFRSLKMEEDELERTLEPIISAFAHAFDQGCSDSSSITSIIKIY